MANVTPNEKHRIEMTFNGKNDVDLIKSLMMHNITWRSLLKRLWTFQF